MLKWLEETGGESSNRPRNPPSERKLRLFATAMWRAHPAILAKHGAQPGLPDICERMADGLATEGEITEARAKHGLDLDGGTLPYARYVRQAASHLASVLLRGPECVPEKRRQARLLRDIIGTPHRPVTFRMPPDCDYRSDLWGLASGLAQAAYEERDAATGRLDPVRLAVLADALEEAGCDSEPLLRHLRGWEWVRGKFSDSWFWHRADAPHVRGCWAVDAVLGRE
jgi:hypothetical protein